nr:putative reverse transcriptase domain-containing protein [Tanacetum cinerariifolium]
MIEPNLTTEADTKKDKTAIAYIHQSLPKEQLLLISKYKTAKEVLDALKKRHVGENRVQQTKQQTIKSEFEMLQMKENESVDSLTSIINKAASLGLTYEDSVVERKLLNAVPDKFLQIVASIEQYSDLDEMSVDEAIERLKTLEERLKRLELVQETTEKISQIKNRIKVARDRQKSYADKRKKPRVQCRFVGQFEITEKVSPVAYRLDLPEELNGVHDTFCVSNLKKCLVDPTLQVFFDEIRVNDMLNFMEEPVEILEREFKKLKRSRIAIVKVRWNSKRGPEFTWKREDQMKLNFVRTRTVLTVVNLCD